VSKIIIAVVVVAVIVFVFMRSSANKSAAAENIQKGADFLAANQTEEGVEAQPSGLQYLVLQKGAGVVNPSVNDRVKVHYHGTLLDGTVFDSSVDRGQPIDFGLNQG